VKVLGKKLGGRNLPKRDGVDKRGRAWMSDGVSQ
jgi:hypothetical protein